ncbi:MAG: hypothetical protein ACK4IK_03055 [Bacteroidia bacterium]
MRIIFIFLLVTTLISCKKEVVTVPPQPYIEFVDIFPKEVKQNMDEILITIKYKDGDGDLGDNNPDVKNVFIKDLRNDLLYSFRLKQLAPDNAGIAITGKININMGNTIMVSNADVEYANFGLFLVDRAGNASNLVITDSITIKK